MTSPVAFCSAAHLSAPVAQSEGGFVHFASRLASIDSALQDWSGVLELDPPYTEVNQGVKRFFRKSGEGVSLRSIQLALLPD